MRVWTDFLASLTRYSRSVKDPSQDKARPKASLQNKASPMHKRERVPIASWAMLREARQSSSTNTEEEAMFAFTYS
eukprot:755354-Pyramimonas_sp.AAC.1